MAATQKFSCRKLVGPSLSQPTLFCFGLAWSNQIAGKMYPEMDIHRTVDSLLFNFFYIRHRWAKCANDVNLGALSQFLALSLELM